MLPNQFTRQSAHLAWIIPSQGRGVIFSPCRATLAKLTAGGSIGHLRGTPGLCDPTVGESRTCYLVESYLENISRASYIKIMIQHSCTIIILGYSLKQLGCVAQVRRQKTTKHTKLSNTFLQQTGALSQAILSCFLAQGFSSPHRGLIQGNEPSIPHSMVANSMLLWAFTSTPCHKRKPGDVLRTKNCYQLSLMIISCLGGPLKLLLGKKKSLTKLEGLGRCS